MAKSTLRGRSVSLETIIFLNERLAEDRQVARDSKMYRPNPQTANIRVPDGHHMGGVRPYIYNEFSRGSEQVCADVVITTVLPNGLPAVLASLRAKNKPFGGCWWMQGGSYHAYRPISDFLLERAMKECGVCPMLEAFIGVFRTYAEDQLASTTNLCYVAFAPFEDVQKARSDKDHADVQIILTYADLYLLSSYTRHSYPMRVFEYALETMPRAQTMEDKVITRVSEKPELLYEVADRVKNDDIVT